MRVAVIPARGGSKRIPRKNIRNFAGQPIIAYAIRCAVESGLFSRVIVSTEDREIEQVARDFGAEVPFVRPQELADDHTGTTEVIAHATHWLLRQHVDLTAVCCIYPTVPFIEREDLAAGVELLETGEWRFVFAATTFPAPLFRSFKRGAGGGVEMYFPEHFTTRSQDLSEALHDAGQFYWGVPDAWIKHERVFAPGSTVVLIDRWRVQDIDTPADWQRAEVMWEVLQNVGA